VSTNGVWTEAARRHDFKLVFDVIDGNPNGDPDAGNMPRVDPETMQGLVTDVAIKRKVRNWVAATRDNQVPWRIYVQNRGIALNTLHQESYDALGLKTSGTRQKRQDIEQARRWMCEQFYDIRTFGAVMTTGVNCGQVRGPVQVGMARSVDPIAAFDMSITRVAVTKPEDAEVIVSDDGSAREGKTTEMGRKPYVPYGVYVACGAVSPLFARDTGFGDEDLALLWEGLTRAWDLDRSAARGIMSCRGLYVFSHTSPYGDAPAHALLDRVQVRRRDLTSVPRSFGAYEATIDPDPLPAGIELNVLAA
jgi:CRISPR-associated protein Csd2